MSEPTDPPPPVEPAVLDALAAADTPDALRAAHRKAKRSVLAFRKRAQKMGPLAKAYTAAVEVWDALNANGATFDERAAGLELVLRQHWPFTREWKYLCKGCDDSGLVIERCRRGARCDGISTRSDDPHGTPGKYRRLCAQFPDSEYEHDYGTPCWCAAGARFRDPGPPRPEDFAQAGKSKPKRDGFSRLGR
jgi:hypothetical protein